MDVLDAIHGRRSIRSYAARPIERELVECIVLDAAQAPPPFRGEIPWTFHVVYGFEQVAALETLVMNHARAHHSNGEPGWSWLERSGFKIFWGAPILILMSGPVEDCCRAGQNLMLYAHARGLGTCWVGSPMQWMKTNEAKNELGIPMDMTPVSALCLGYPETVPEASLKGRPPIIWIE